MRLLLTERELLPRFTFQGRVIAWQCSICAKMFSLSFDELQSLYYAERPSYIAADFQAHNCRIAVYTLAEEIQRTDEQKVKENAYSSLLARFKKQ